MRVAPSVASSVNALTSRPWASRIAGSPPPSAAPSASGGPVCRRRQATQIVEADLRGRKAAELRGGLRVQIAQQPIAKPVVGHRPQLLLDRFERVPERRAARQGFVEIKPARIKPHREQAGEPADRAREVDVGKNLLAAVPLQIKQNRRAGAPLTPPAPVRNSQYQAGQQHIVDPAMEGRRNPGQQSPRDRSRQREREMAGRAGDVPIGIERAVSQRKSRLTQHPGPERKLSHHARILRVSHQTLGPTSERGSGRHQRRRPPARNRLPGRRKVGHQDAPRHPVHRKVMDGEQQPSGALRSGIEPHRLHHHPGRRSKPLFRRQCLFADAGAQARPHRARQRRFAAGSPRPAPRQAAPPPDSIRGFPQRQPCTAATHRDDRAGPARPR